jgi:predicted dehydrogenase
LPSVPIDPNFRDRPPLGFAAAGLEHAHIHAQCRGLVSAGARLKWVYDPDPAKVAKFREEFPFARAARALGEVLADPEVGLIASAAIPRERAELGCRIMQAGKDFFTDKAPFTSLAQLAEARRIVAATGRKHLVYFSERFQHGGVRRATELASSGALGRIVHVTSFLPHRLNAPQRPAWFFDREQAGGILGDLACHAIDQFLTWTGADDATVTHAATANHAHPEYAGFSDHGELTLRTAGGATGFIRVDWLSPEGLRGWGDARSFLVGTHATLELRKYIDVTREVSGNHLFFVDDRGEHHDRAEDSSAGFQQLIADCLDRTETAMTQEHAFKVAEISLRAQALADSLAA